MKMTTSRYVKGVAFFNKRYIKGQGVGPRGGAYPYYPPPPGGELISIEPSITYPDASTKGYFFTTTQNLKIGKEIERVSNCCYLGFKLDRNLSWNEHTELICNKRSKHLGLLSRISC